MSRRLRRNRVRLGHFQDQIGLAQLPAFGEFGLRRQVTGIPFFRAWLGPFGDRGDLVIAQPTDIASFAEVRIGLPRGHAARGSDVMNEIGPLGRILVFQQRERPNLARSMARGEVLEQDRSNVLGIGNLVGLADGTRTNKAIQRWPTSATVCGVYA